MAESRVTQKMAAILAADAVGYTRLMADDETATIDSLDAARAVFIEHIEANQGRVVDTAGDSVLAVFETIAGAVRAAEAIQGRLTEINEPLLDERRMHFRIGIHLGDIHEKTDGTVYGDGVNIAARLESIAAPGAIIVSDVVQGALRGRLDITFADAGTHEVKNIAEPVRAYHVGVGGEVAPSTAVMRVEKSSIAVLPFDNMSRDEDQEYFSDGISEDLITALSRVRWLTVIARNSTFTYKGKAVDVKQVGRELGVSYVLEGSVRKVGGRVRITAQLIDAETGAHIWAERYDRELEDIFALQDEITETITAAIAPELEALERERAHRKPPESLDAWEAYQRGMWHLFQVTPEDSAIARAHFREAIARAPDFAPLHAGLAYSQFLAHVFAYSDADLDEALTAARRAVALDDRDAMAHFALGRVLTALREIDDAVKEIEAAIFLTPSFALAYHALGFCRVIEGRNQEAIAAFDMAIRLSPHDPGLFAMESVRAAAHAALGDLDNALIDARNATRRANAPIKIPFGTYNMLIAVLGQLGRNDEAQSVVAQLRKHDPNFRPETSARIFGFTDPARYAWYVDGLVKAGVPLEGWQNEEAGNKKDR